MGWFWAQGLQNTRWRFYLNKIPQFISIHLYSNGILRTSIFMRIFGVCCKSISSVAGTSQTALIQRYGLSCVQRVQNLKLLEISNNMNTQLEYSKHLQSNRSLLFLGSASFGGKQKSSNVAEGLWRCITSWYSWAIGLPGALPHMPRGRVTAHLW